MTAFLHISLHLTKIVLTVDWDRPSVTRCCMGPILLVNRVVRGSVAVRFVYGSVLGRGVVRQCCPLVGLGIEEYDLQVECCPLCNLRLVLKLVLCQ